MARKSSRLLVAATAALLLAGTSLAPLPAMAESTTTPAAAAATPAVPPTVTVDIPSIEAVDSSIDGPTLKAIFSGDIAGHAAELAKLTATSITVPEISVTFTTAGDSFTSVYRDIVLDKVTDGVAQAASIGGGEFSGGSGDKAVSMTLGKMSAGLLDIGGILAFYGLVPAPADQPLKTMYKDVELTGGTLDAADMSCKLGGIRIAELKARPLKVSIAELMTLVAAAEGGDMPSPALVGKLIAAYADLFYAFESSPMTLDRLDCAGEDENGQPLSFGFGPLTVGGFGNGRYPDVKAEKIAIAATDSDEAGTVSLDQVTFKGFDLTGTLKVLNEAGPNVDEAWFEANMRRLIPPFEGFSFSGLDMDVPDPDQGATRIKARVASFDLTLGDYFSGIPTRVSTEASHIVFDVPPAGDDEDDDTFAELRKLGFAQLDLGFAFGTHRDAATDTVTIDKAELSGANLGTFSVGGTLGNAGEALYSGDADQAMAAAMALTVKSTTLNLVDAGLAKLVITRAGAEEGLDFETARTKFSGMAQGLVLVLMGGSPEAHKLGEALGKFVGGGKSLAITATAKDPAGLTLPDFLEAQDNPTELATKMSIDAKAE